MEEVFLQKKYTMEEASSTLFFKWRKYCLKIDEDSSCKEEKVEDFILKPEKLMETKKLRAASPLSLSIFWAKKKKILLGFGDFGPKHKEIFLPKTCLALRFTTECKEAVCPNLT